MKIGDPYVREILDNSINTSSELKEYKEAVNPKLSEYAERIDSFEERFKKIYKILREIDKQLIVIGSNVKSQKDGILQNYDEDEVLTKRVERIEGILNL